jgi:hypothetical protein
MSGMGVASVSARTSMYPIPNVPPFGVYKLALPEWQAYAHETLIGAQDPMRVLVDSLDLPAGSGERFEVYADFAATFVERRDTRDMEERADIDFGTVVERVGNLVAAEEIIAVPITDLEWCASKIVAPFDQDSVEYKRLYDQRAEIERILLDAGMEEPPVRLPHHTSLAGFSFKRETPPLHTRIDSSERSSLMRMMSRRLLGAGIDSVELGGLIVGRNYTTPFDAGDWLTNSCVEIVSCSSLEGI